MKRKLTSEEKVTCEKAIKQIEDRLNILDFYKDYYNLMLSKGLDRQFLEKRMEFNQKNKEVIKEIEESKNIINELKKQLSEGVEVKDGANKARGSK
jgi:hypothetical protein